MLVANPLCWFCRDAAQIFEKANTTSKKINDKIEKNGTHKERLKRHN
jgi:hypothetical protein